MSRVLAGARSLAARLQPHLPGERVAANRAFDTAFGAATWFVPAQLLVIGTPLPVIGLFGGLWLALARPEHADRLLVALGLGRPVVRHGLAVAGLALWTLAPLVGPLTGIPVWAWFYVGLLGVAPYGGVGSRPDAVTVVFGSALPPAVALVVIAPLLAAGGLVAGLQAAFAVVTALGVVVLTLGVDDSPVEYPSLSMPEFVESGKRLSPSDRRLLLADTWTRSGLALIGPLFVAFSIQRLGDGLGEGAGVVALSLAFAVGAAGAAHRALPRVRAVGEWTRPLLATFGLCVATAAPLAVLLVPATPLAFAVTFLAVGVGQVGWTVVDNEVDELLGDRHPTYRAARAVVLVPAALVGGLLFAVAPATAFVLSSAAGTVGTVTYLRRVAR
ncbi:hypothetical protein ACFPYI_06645 [Halomarina salina]|uniref:MFS transporter n=1 Tax=Halomarina salina TaxID=1872699 RepID=A0ABD5RL05_9EURY|nr:hypothetical protein [Halomarina salina]